MFSKKSSIHVSYLCALFLLMRKVRREGLMSIECDIETPDHESTVFAQFPELFDYPQHFQFMRDVLRLMVCGCQELPATSFFAATAKKSFLDGGGKDESLWDCVWAMLYAILSGCSHQVSAEFGRQAIPWKKRPTFNELEDLLKDIKYTYQGGSSGDRLATRELIAEALDALFARMDASA